MGTISWLGVLKSKKKKKERKKRKGKALTFKRGCCTGAACRLTSVHTKKHEKIHRKGPYFKITASSAPFTIVSGRINIGAPRGLWIHVLPTYCCPFLSCRSISRPIYIGKNQNPKTWVFCCTVYTARKTPISFRFFWQEKRMREKPRIYWFFGKWCACATSLYLWPYT